MSGDPSPEPVLTCVVDPDTAELVSVLLFEAGALAIGEETVDGQVALRAGFEREADAHAAATAVANWTVASVELVAPTWQTEQRIGFQPIQVGPWFVSTPDDESPVPDGLRHLRIEPGRSFGHGAHPTTRLLLELLPAVVRPGVTVLDVGTGTGVLAVAAASLGARVQAIDVDPEAVSCAGENVRGNGFDHLVDVSLSDGGSGFGEATDVALVNVTIDQHRRIAAHLQDTPTVLISGLLDHQMDEAVSLYARSITALVADAGWQAANLRGDRA